MAAVGTGAEKAGNRQSQQIAAATLQAVAAAWLAAGRGFPELAETALSSTKTVAALRALPLLSALISAVPQVTCCSLLRFPSLPSLILSTLKVLCFPELCCWCDMAYGLGL